MARVEDVPSEEEEEPEVIIEDDATEQDEIDNESEASEEDDMSETEEADRLLEEKVRDIEEQLNNDPYNYDLHVQLIELLYKMSDLERMRAAFEGLHSLMPLQPEQWLAWTQAESSVAHTPKEREAVNQLHRRATDAVYSIPLYLQWLMFGISGPVEEARSTFGLITRRVGYDPAATHDIWRAITMFERIRLSDMSEADSDLFSEQVVRTARCLGEQLTRPLPDTTTALRELNELVESHPGRLREGYLDTILNQHEEVKEIREKIAAFEERLQTAELNEKVEIYKEYIDMIKQLYNDDKDRDGPFNVLEMCSCLYDRATYECLASDNVESLFSDYANHALRLSYDAGSRALDVCVTRRPNAAKYWLCCMRHREKQGRPLDEITSILERALQNKLSHADCESIWLGYLECLRRHTDMESPEQKEKLRKNFNHAIDTLRTMYPEEEMPCEISLFWARLEYTRMDSPARGKEIFEQIFESAYNKSQSTLWLALIELEQSRQPRPPDKKLRELHRRAVKFAADYPPCVCDRWIAFERDYGTLESLTQCRDTCGEALEKWKQSYQTQKETKQNSKKGKGKKQQKTDAKASTKASESPNASKHDTDKQSERRKKRGADDESYSQAKKKKDSSEIKQNGVKRVHEQADAEVEKKRQRIDSGGDRTQRSTSVESSQDKQSCTLFISNLGYKFNEKELRSILMQWGTVIELRVVSGQKSAGGCYCYCEYDKPDSVEEAIKHDRTLLDNRPIFLSRYQSRKDKGHSFKYATTQERNKLFVRNIPFSCCTEERLRGVFEKYGQLKDVRAVTHKTGRPKGLAYIEYEDEKSASAALQATDNLTIEERNIQVSFSDPPPRVDKAGTSLGQERRDMGSKEHRRTQLSSFVPRVLQKPTPGPSTSDPGKKTMSNSDFRNLLLNNK